jgi:hypothetical protein
VSKFTRKVTKLEVDAPLRSVYDSASSPEDILNAKGIPFVA